MTKQKRHAGKVSRPGQSVTVEQRPVFRPYKPRSYGSVKSVVYDLIANAGGVKEVAFRFGIDDSLPAAWGIDTSEKEISFARTAALTSPDNTVAAEYLAHLAGGVFMPVPRGEGTMVALTADLAREVGETVSRIVIALADGEMNGAEAEGALKEIDDDLVILMGLRAEVLARMKRRP